MKSPTMSDHFPELHYSLFLKNQQKAQHSESDSTILWNENSELIKKDLNFKKSTLIARYKV